MSCADNTINQIQKWNIVYVWAYVNKKIYMVRGVMLQMFNTQKYENQIILCMFNIVHVRKFISGKIKIVYLQNCTNVEN